MNLRRFDLNLLTVLDALLTERNVTRAGQRVFLSQSAVSGALAKLRVFFNDPLLVRKGRVFQLTPRGEELARELRTLLPRLQQLATSGPVFDPATAEHTFTVQMSDYSTTVLMPEIARRLRATAPHVSIEVLPQTVARRASITEQLYDLVIGPVEYASADHPMERLLFDRWVCVVSADAERYAHGLTLESYLAAAHVAVRCGDVSLPVIEEWHLRKSGFSRYTMLRLPYLALPGGVIEGTDLIAVTQERLARIWEKVANIRILPPPYPIPDQILHMQWHARERNNTALAWLRGIFHDAARALGAHPDNRAAGAEKVVDSNGVQNMDSGALEKLRRMSCG